MLAIGLSFQSLRRRLRLIDSHSAGCKVGEIQLPLILELIVCVAFDWCCMTAPWCIANQLVFKLFNWSTDIWWSPAAFCQSVRLSVCHFHLKSWKSTDQVECGRAFDFMDIYIYSIPDSTWVQWRTTHAGHCSVARIAVNERRDCRLPISFSSYETRSFIRFALSDFYHVDHIQQVPPPGGNCRQCIANNKDFIGFRRNRSSCAARTVNGLPKICHQVSPNNAIWVRDISWQGHSWVSGLTSVCVLHAEPQSFGCPLWAEVRRKVVYSVVSLCICAEMHWHNCMRLTC